MDDRVVPQHWHTVGAAVTVPPNGPGIYERGKQLGALRRELEQVDSRFDGAGRSEMLLEIPECLLADGLQLRRRGKGLRNGALLQELPVEPDEDRPADDRAAPSRIEPARDVPVVPVDGETIRR